MRRCEAVALVVVAVMTVTAGCGSGGRSAATTSPTARGASSSTPATTTTVPPPSALDGLQAFFTAVGAADARLRSAATAVNGGVTASTITLDQATKDAIAAADPSPARTAIPAGLPPALERAVLVVYNDLVSRHSALRGVQFEDRAMALACLRNGAAPSARFDVDVASARSLAAATPPVAPVAPESQAAEELAVRFAWIDEVNNGCAGCGGMVIRELVPITVYPGPTTPPLYDRTFDGQIDSGTSSVYFTAGYVPGSGWRVVLNAC